MKKEKMLNVDRKISIQNLDPIQKNKEQFNLLRELQTKPRMSNKN